MGVEGVGGELRTGRESGVGGGGRPQSLDARPGLHLWFTHSAEMSFFFLRCRLDEMQTLLAAHRGPAGSPVCPVCPYRVMRGARHAMACWININMNVNGDHQMIPFSCSPVVFCGSNQ